MTEDQAYAERLQRRTGARRRQWPDVQIPYRRNVLRLCPCLVLEVRCGIARGPAHRDGRAIGVGLNPASVPVARRQGLRAYAPEQFRVGPAAIVGAFDSLLIAHVLQHLHAVEADVVMITPQERSWRSDSTHARCIGPRELQETARRLGLLKPKVALLALPRLAGRLLTYNEFVAVTVSTTGDAA